MNAINVRMLVMVFVIVACTSIVALIISAIKKAVAKNAMSGGAIPFDPSVKPAIHVEYMKSGSLLDDGKCGWLDIECEDGETKTIPLIFGKKLPNAVTIQLSVSKYRITYRSQSKAVAAASGIMRNINESNGAMGAFANAVYNAGVGGQLSSVVVNVDEEFVLRLRCSTNGMDKSCQIIS